MVISANTIVISAKKHWAIKKAQLCELDLAEISMLRWMRGEVPKLDM